MLSPGHGHSKSLRTKSFETHTNSKTLLLFGFVEVVQDYEDLHFGLVAVMQAESFPSTLTGVKLLSSAWYWVVLQSF